MKRNIIIINALSVLLLGVGGVSAAKGVRTGGPRPDAVSALAAVTAEGVDVAAGRIDGVSVSDVKVARDGSKVAVDFSLDVSGLKVKSSMAVLLTPCIVNGTDSLALPSVGIYGRQRYWYYQRSGGPISGEGETSFVTGDNEPVIPYRAEASYGEWMNGSRLVLLRRDYSCCGEKGSGQTAELVSRTLWTPATPELIYVSPKGEKTKTRSLSGTAYIEFPVDRTEIRPDFRGNAAELGRIRATIDSVRNDSDITVTSVYLKGFASPEGSYAHNAELARKRTETLRGYVLGLYHFAPSVVTFGYEPENWDGLVKWLEGSSLSGASALLKIAKDSSLDPDAREARIRADYPEDYKTLLSEVYPRLRCTEYRIEYNIRTFTDPEEILNVMKTQPSKLSLEELFVAAGSLETGSAEFNSVFDIAAAMYPDDGTANLNAANAAMERGDLKTAAERLGKAGDSAEADYSRGVLAVMRGEYSSAADFFRKAAGKGLEAAGKQAETFSEYSPAPGGR